MGLRFTRYLYAHSNKCVLRQQFVQALYSLEKPPLASCIMGCCTLLVVTRGPPNNYATHAEAVAAIPRLYY